MGEMGADPNVVNRRRGTALHAAAWTGNGEVVRGVLEGGRGGKKVDAGVRDKDGLTAWEVWKSPGVGGVGVEEF